MKTTYQFKNILFILLICTSLSIKSQEYVIPPSPDASALGQIAESQVNLSTGAVDISIPLYEIQCKGFNLPITLDYNTQGFKVNSIASWVGLGWTLNAGGVITRAVRGLPDDGNPYNFGDPANSNHTEAGYLNNYVGKLLQNGNVLTLDTFNNYISKQYDTEQDIFYYNFNGRTGSFVFDAYGNIRKLDYNNISFSVTKNATYNNIDGFTAITEDGTQYFFTQIETAIIFSESSAVPFSPIQPYQAYSYNSSWYLTKIITINNEEIDFSYINKTYYLAPLPNYQEIRYTTKSDCSDGLFQVWGCVTQWPYLLSQITTPNSKIIFSLTPTTREDYVGFTSGTFTTCKMGYSLGSISINSLNGALIKEYDFNYSYFAPTGQTDAIYKRLKLNSIQEIGSDLMSKLPYTFSYYESEELPMFFSAEQDLWGFYNGNSSTTLIPQLYVYPGLSGSERFSIFPKSNYTGSDNFLISTGADRRPNENKMKACMLTQIQYPTGGIRSFDYEAHRCIYEGDLITGGGLRIKSITDYDGINHANDVIKTYTYNYFDTNQPSGKLLNMPIYAYTDNSSYNYIDGTHIDLSKINYNFNSPDYYKYFLKRFSTDQSSLGIQGSSNVIYNEVICQTGQTGYTVNRYNIPALYNDDNDCSTQTSSSCNCDPTYSGSCDNLYSISQPVAIKISMAYLNKMDFTKNTYPFAPNLNYSWNRGLLISSKQYDLNKNPIEETDYNYSIFGKKNYTLSLKFGVIHDISYTGDEIDDLLVYSIYKNIVDSKKVLNAKTEIMYNPKDNSKSLSVTTYYQYNNYSQISSVSQIQSDRSNLTTTYKYPLDYSFNGLILGSQNLPCDEFSKGLFNMQNKNILNQPIEVVNYANNNIVNASLYTYRSDNLKLSNVSKIYSSSPISSSNFTASSLSQTLCDFPGSQSMVSAVLFNSDSKYQTETTYDAYDTQGNLLQLHKDKDINISYIWGYNKTYPIAEVTNATKDEIFFTSYEEDTDFDDPTNKCTCQKHSGNQCVRVTPGGYNGSHDFAKVNLTSGKYKYSAWIKTSGTGVFLDIKDFTPGVTGASYISVSVPNTNGQWQYFEVTADMTTGTFPTSTTVRAEIGNGGTTVSYVDDVRFAPADAQMTTYTYQPLVGMTSQTDAKNFTTTYEYDVLGRLVNVRDKNNKILKQYSYHYAGGTDVGIASPTHCNCSGDPEFSYTTALPGNYTLYNQPITFTASTDPSYITYAWDFGDNTSGTGATVTHTYTQFLSGNSVNVKLTITDPYGTKSTTQAVSLPRVYLSQPLQNYTGITSDYYVDNDQIIIFGVTPSGTTSNEQYALYWEYQENFDPSNFSIESAQPVMVTNTSGTYEQVVTQSEVYGPPSYLLDLKSSNLTFIDYTQLTYKMVLILYNVNDPDNLFTYAPVTFHPGSRPAGTGGQFVCSFPNNQSVCDGSNYIRINSVTYTGLDASGRVTDNSSAVVNYTSSGGFVPYYYLTPSGTQIGSIKVPIAGSNIHSESNGSSTVTFNYILPDYCSNNNNAQWLFYFTRIKNGSPDPGLYTIYNFPFSIPVVTCQ